MQCLTENALVQLIPVVGPRMKFIKQLESLKKTSRPESIDVVEEGTPIANEEMEVQDRIPADTEVKARDIHYLQLYFTIHTERGWNLITKLAVPALMTI